MSLTFKLYLKRVAIHITFFDKFIKRRVKYKYFN